MHFTEILKKADTKDCIVVSFDVKSLFTNVPLEVIKQRIQDDTTLTIKSIMQLLRKCLTTTHFMGSQLSPRVASIYIYGMFQGDGQLIPVRRNPNSGSDTLTIPLFYGNTEKGGWVSSLTISITTDHLSNSQWRLKKKTRSHSLTYNCRQQTRGTCGSYRLHHVKSEVIKTLDERGDNICFEKIKSQNGNTSNKYSTERMDTPKTS